jgi:hypothetical protein
MAFVIAADRRTVSLAIATEYEPSPQRRPDLPADARTDEPAGQLAARELEIQRIDSALRRAEALSVDAAAALKGVA